MTYVRNDVCSTHEKFSEFLVFRRYILLENCVYTKANYPGDKTGIFRTANRIRRGNSADMLYIIIISGARVLDLVTYDARKFLHARTKRRIAR